MRYLLQLSERWSCHIWNVDRMKFASLEANKGFSLSHSSYLSPSFWEVSRHDCIVVDWDFKP